MGTDVIVDLLKAFGAPGLIVGFMLWDRVERNKLDAKRTEADIEMARGLTAMGKDFQHLAELIRAGGFNNVRQVFGGTEANGRKGIEKTHNGRNRRDIETD